MKQLKHVQAISSLSFIANSDGGELYREIEGQPPDLIPSDHGFVFFDGFKALEIVRAARPNLPCIFVSGSNYPDIVATMCHQGATDYVFKRDLGDLPAAMRTALDKSEGDEPLSTSAG